MTRVTYSFDFEGTPEDARIMAGAFMVQIEMAVARANHIASQPGFSRIIKAKIGHWELASIEEKK